MLLNRRCLWLLATCGVVEAVRPVEPFGDDADIMLERRPPSVSVSLENRSDTSSFNGSKSWLASHPETHHEIVNAHARSSSENQQHNGPLVAALELTKSSAPGPGAHNGQGLELPKLVQRALVHVAEEANEKATPLNDDGQAIHIAVGDKVEVDVPFESISSLDGSIVEVTKESGIGVVDEKNKVGDALVDFPHVGKQWIITGYFGKLQKKVTNQQLPEAVLDVASHMKDEPKEEGGTDEPEEAGSTGASDELTKEDSEVKSATNATGGAAPSKYEGPSDYELAKFVQRWQYVAGQSMIKTMQEQIAAKASDGLISPSASN